VSSVLQSLGPGWDAESVTCACRHRHSRCLRLASLPFHSPTVDFISHHLANTSLISYIYWKNGRHSLRALQLASAIQATDSSRSHAPARPSDRTTTSRTRLSLRRSQCWPSGSRVRGLPGRSATSRLPVIPVSSPRSSTFPAGLPRAFAGSVLGRGLPAYEPSISSTYATAATSCWAKYVELGSGFPLERGSIGT
jgi:hypothetical protein